MRGPLVRAIFLVTALAGAALVLAGGASGSADKPRVLAIKFDADINPVTQDFVTTQLKRAADEHYDAAVILLNTPGGLITAMDKIVIAELDAKVPVIVYVSPRGGFAGSAGVFVSEAADVLAMAPETNIGSSTPIDATGQNIGTDLRRKMITHEAANLRALMQAHHRNATWANLAVGAAASQAHGKVDRRMNRTAQEALKEHIVDVVAPDLATLLDRVDGRHVTSPGRDFTLHTRGAHVTTVGMSFFQRLLTVLIDPNVIGLLFLLGVLGIGFEIFHPGVVLPGTLGAIAMIAALWGFTVLPFSWAGIALILFGIGLFVLEAHVPAHGAIALSGIIALVIGFLLLFRGAPAPYRVNQGAVITVAVLIGGAWAIVVSKAMQARRMPVKVGPHMLLGATGDARSGQLVHVRGELWQARTEDGDPLAPGEAVEVEAVDGLTLVVRRAHDHVASA